MDYSTAGDDVLRARFIETASLLRSLTAERKLLAAELAKREKHAAAKVRMRALSDDERAALREVLAE